ncbi:hypothetical protein CLHUN_42990 [Ruminiclostridium hungatei]|uniref:Uncharacterized protein n=1 Tax=Ruminiclostridium hungatei TaxID=48256 RepID=A0A1V4SDM7_RUMHU|nr:hypothetical protein CLHUN_42990 [Ruminiclostridium hungatei]
MENRKIEITDEPTKVYNFQVDDFHTYHVGDNGVLVHNANYNKGTPKTWTSTDKYVGETANAIEAKYPGKVVDVNKKVYRADGTPLTDYDIELNNAIIQVKQGGGKGATKQAINTASSTSKEVIVYLPDQNPGAAVVKGLQKEGFKVFTNQQDLLNYLK